MVQYCLHKDPKDSSALGEQDEVHTHARACADRFPAAGREETCRLRAVWVSRRIVGEIAGHGGERGATYSENGRLSTLSRPLQFG